MTVLGIKLTIPDRSRLLRLIAVLFFVLFLAGMLRLAGLPIDYARGIILGVFSGALACAFGIEMPKHGWRGGAIAVLLWLILVSLLVTTRMLWQTN